MSPPNGKAHPEMSRPTPGGQYCSRSRPDDCSQGLYQLSQKDEVWDSAERRSMPLFLAEIHRCRARLFFRQSPYLWTSPAHDLAEAERLISHHGYLRREDELHHAKKEILGG